MEQSHAGLCKTLTRERDLSKAYYSTLEAAYRLGLLDWEETGLPFGWQQGNGTSRILQPPQPQSSVPLFLREHLSDFMNDPYLPPLTLPRDPSKAESEHPKADTDAAQVMLDENLSKMCAAERSKAQLYEQLVAAAIERDAANRREIFMPASPSKSISMPVNE